MVGPKRKATIVDTGVRKPLDLKIHVPVESMVEPEQMDLELDPFAGQEATRKSIWPAIYPELLKLVKEHRSTLIFVNNRRAAERLALRLNELAEEPLARAHHGSPRARGAADRRGAAEGRRAAVPGGDVVAGARHRHGRRGPRAAGRVAEVGHGRPAADRPRRPQRRRHVEGPHLPEVPRRPARVRGRRAAHARGQDRDDGRPAQPARRARAADRRDGRHRRGRRRSPSTSSRRCSRAPTRTPSCRAPQLENVLDMLDGRYPIRGVRRAAAADRLGPRERQRSAPARARARWRSPTPARSRTAACTRVNLPDGRRVGELDEEMVYEARPGQVFLLGASSWRIEEITRDRVIVTPAPGVPGAVPFWKGDGLGRPRELGEAIGAFARWAVDQDPATLAHELRPRRQGRHQPRRVPARAAGGDAGRAERPHDRDRALPRRDRRLAGLRAVARSAAACTPPGASRCPPASARSTAWSRTRSGPTTASSSTSPTPTSRPGEELMLIDPDELEDLVVGELGGSALFGARFRENAGRALLIPRAYPGQAHAAVAAAAEVAVAARGRAPLRAVPDRARDLPRGPARRAGPARPARAADQAAPARALAGRGRDADRVAVRLLAAVRLRRHVHVRGRPAQRRAPRRGAGAGPRAAARAARPGGAARADRPGRAGDRRGRPAAALGPHARRQRRRAARRAAPRRRPHARRGACCAAARDAWLRAAARRAARDRAARRRREALGRGRGRRALPRRAGRRAALRPAGGVHRRRAGRDGAARAPLRPHPRPVRDAARCATATASTSRRCSSGSSSPATSCAASCGPAGPRASGATPRCCAACAGPRSPPCAPRSSPPTSAPSPASRRQLAGRRPPPAGRRRRSTGCARCSCRSRGCRCRSRCGSATCCRAAPAPTRRRGWTSCARAARSCGSAPARSAAAPAAWRCTSATTRR